MESVGIVVKPNSATAEDIALEVIEELSKYGVRILVEEVSRSSYDSLSQYEPFSLRDPPNRLIVIGGDGTLLRTVMFLGRPDTVIMTIRAGKRGFLLDVEPYMAREKIGDFLEGNYELTRYMRLEVKPPQHDRVCVLNDAVFIANKSKLVSLSIDVDGQRAMNIDGDGVIISTTVGSTAYSLSAGGPIVDPRLEVTIITPINPVQLHLRPVVTLPEARIQVMVSHSSNPLYLSLDGQVILDLLPGDIVSITRCSTPALIARFEWWKNHFERVYTRIFSYI